MSRSDQKPRVVVTRTLPQAVHDRLSALYDTELNVSDLPLTKVDLIRAFQSADAVVTTVSDRIDASVLNGPGIRARMIANVGVGFSNIDTQAAENASIVVSNTPDVLTEATADIALLLILASTRRAYAAEQLLRQGNWAGFSIVAGLGAGVQGKTLGIIGMGRIGQATARRAALGLGMKVVFYNRSTVQGLDFKAEQLTSIEDVMTRADVVSLHIPGGGAKPPIDRALLALMKPTAHLVNTARGDVIDEEALIDALETGQIAGAGLDVFAHEPTIPERLKALTNVTLLPHVGSATLEVRTAMGMLAADNLEAFFAGREMPSRVV